MSNGTLRSVPFRKQNLSPEQAVVSMERGIRLTNGNGLPHITYGELTDRNYLSYRLRSLPGARCRQGGADERLKQRGIQLVEGDRAERPV